MLPVESENRSVGMRVVNLLRSDALVIPLQPYSIPPPHLPTPPPFLCKLPLRPTPLLTAPTAHGSCSAVQCSAGVRLLHGIAEVLSPPCPPPSTALPSPPFSLSPTLSSPSLQWLGLWLVHYNAALACIGCMVLQGFIDDVLETPSRTTCSRHLAACEWVLAWVLGNECWGMGAGVWALGNGRWGMGAGEWALGNGRWGMGAGEWALGNGRWGMGAGEWALGNGRWEMGAGEWALGNGFWGMGAGEWALGNGFWGMGAGEWALGNGRWGMGAGEWALGNGRWGMGAGEWALGNVLS
ncbi:unnamed protein product [Closterium sp. Naga37s-1]|nr:unnamed protein product [Closterium sp. Naga37s-1]